METLVFRLAMAAAALWVLDDAFWHREPGTAVGDHPASGLVPVALAVLLAVTYPHLRAGARAAAALTAGPLMIVAGVVDGVRHVAVDRLAGDDVTAILAGVMGVVLVGLGTAGLWRSRRLDERRLRRYARRTLVVGVAALAGVFVVMPVAFAIVGNHKARAPVARADLGRPYIDVSLKTSDGLRLAGWYVPSRNGAAVIAFPGRKGPVRHARMLVRHGYGVLLLDRRGEGASEGDFNARGWGGEPDLHAAIAYLRRRPDVHGGRIGGLGLSVGGELLLRTAARDAGLRAVVSEGAGLGSVAEQKHMPDTPPEPLRWIAPITMETAAGVVLSDHLPPTDIADLMPKIAPRPVLLIRGMRGNGDESLNRAYRNAGGPTSQLWEIANAGHTGGISAAPAAYERRVVGFFDRALRPHAAPVVPTLPVPEGQYAVGRTTLHLVDVKRRDPFKPTRPRELMATVTYPARHAERYPRGPWLGRAVAQELEASLSAPPMRLAPGSVDLVGAVAHARLDAPVAQPSGSGAGGWPVVLFSPGGGALRELNTAQIEDLASRGYVVVSMDHTYEAPLVEFPGGRVARQVSPGLSTPGSKGQDPKVMRVVFKRAIDTRVADTRFVLDRLAALDRARRPGGSWRGLPAGLRGGLDLSRVGMFGYSYGGYTAAETMLYDRRIDAGINLDGAMAHGFGTSKDWPYAPGQVVRRGLDRPFLLFGSTGHNHLPSGGFRTGDPSWREFWANQRGWKRDVTLRDSAHGSFGDTQVADPQIARGLGLPLATLEPEIGTIDPNRSIAAQRASIASFFDLHLRGRDNHLLDGPSAAFPEIEFVR